MHLPKPKSGKSDPGKSTGGTANATELQDPLPSASRDEPAGADNVPIEESNTQTSAKTTNDASSSKAEAWSVYRQFNRPVRKTNIKAKTKLESSAMAAKIAAAAAAASKSNVDQDLPRSSAINPGELPKPLPEVILDNIPLFVSEDDVNGFYAKEMPKKKGKKRAQQNQQQPPPMDMSENYDPNKPNDYERYKEEREQEKVQKRREIREERQRQRQRSRSSSPYYSNDRSRSRSRSPSPKKQGRVFAPPKDFYNTSPHPRSRSSSPPEFHPSPQVLNEQYAEDEHSYEDEIDMQAMGERHDMGEGEVDSNIHLSEQTETGRETDPFPSGDPSRVIMLTNMVEPREVDEEIYSWTKDICKKFGKMENMLVYEVPNTGRVPVEHAVRVFVKFKELESAQRALEELSGHEYKGRTIAVRYYDNDRFAQLDLVPTEEEYAQYQFNNNER